MAPRIFPLPLGRLRVVLWVASLGLIMTTGAAIMLFAAIVTLFRARRFYTEVIGRRTAGAILRAAGVRVITPPSFPSPESRQTVYISNHLSTLDVFILLSLGLPGTRYFMAGWLRKFVPLGIITHLMGTFHTVLQNRPEKRTRIFQNAERVLRRTGDSVYLSPEGRRVTGGSVGPFNKGAFHLATALGAPIQPFYIEIPPRIDPGLGYGVVPGEVRIHPLPPVETIDWRIEDLIQNKEMVRNMFVRFEKGLYPGGRDGGRS